MDMDITDQVNDFYKLMQDGNDELLAAMEDEIEPPMKRVKFEAPSPAVNTTDQGNDFSKLMEDGNDELLAAMKDEIEPPLKRIKFEAPPPAVPLPFFFRCKENSISYSWLNILDHLGPTSEWGPMKQQYRAAFWSKNLGYKDRLFVGSLCYQNGVSISVACDFFEIRKIDKFHIRKLKQLYDYWDDESHGFERRQKYFAYEMNQRCFADLNGVPREGQQKYCWLEMQCKALWQTIVQKYSKPAVKDVQDDA